MSNGKSPAPLRGQVWFFALSESQGEKPLVVVSNNHRNAGRDSILAVRITTAPKPRLPTIVRLPAGQPVVGAALCDDVTVVGRQRLRRYAGALSAPVMSRIDMGLKTALGLGN